MNHSTRALVSFHSDEGFDGEMGLSRRGVGKIVSVKTAKQFGQAAGQFSITLKRTAGGPAITDLWEEPEGVWTRIKFMCDGRVYDSMLGNVDSISEPVQRSEGGARSEMYTITGRDFGKVFETTELYINMHESVGALPAVPMYSAVHENLIGTPDDFIRTLITAWLGNNGVADKQWVLPSSMLGGFFFDELNRSTIARSLRGNLFDPTLLNPDQKGRKLWDAMQEYSNPLLNEMWCDLAPDPRLRNPLQRVDQLRPALYLRERPFPSMRVPGASWHRLRTHKLTPSDIAGRMIVKGGAQGRFNYWFINSLGIGGSSIGSRAAVQDATATQPGHPGGCPIYDLDSIRRFGLRRWEQETRFAPVDDDSNFFRVIAKWLNICHDWYVVTPMQLSGSIQTSHLMPWIRIGERVHEERLDGAHLTYYVEGVEHEFSFPGPGRTTLTLTRGEADGANLLAKVYRRYFSLDQQRTLSAVDSALDRYDAESPAAGAPDDVLIATTDGRRATEAALGVTGPGPSVSGAPVGETFAGEEAAADPTSVAAATAGGDSQRADPEMNFPDVDTTDADAALPPHSIQLDEFRITAGEPLTEDGLMSEAPISTGVPTPRTVTLDEPIVIEPRRRGRRGLPPSIM